MAHDTVVATPSPGDSPALRDEIARSWERSRSSGLRPDDSLERFSVSDVDRRSRLLAAAEPVLDRMESMLARTRYCVLLSDRDARLVDLRFGSHQVRDAVTATGTVLGRPFSEQTSGTNSIATVHELRVPVSVRGDEHYIEAMKGFSCHGHPLIHPVTRRIEGVLDITYLVDEDNPLLRPLLAQSASDIQSRLLEETRSSEQLLFAAFQRSNASRRGAPVIALADEILLENSSASALVGSDDHAALRAQIEGSSLRAGVIESMTLRAGRAVRIRWERPPAGAGVVLEIDPLDAPTVIDTANRPPTARTAAVIGEPGTGRSTALSEWAARFDADTDRFDAAELAVDDAHAWMTRVSTRLRDGDAVVLVENVHLLPDLQACALREAIASATARVGLSSNPVDAAGPEHRRLVSGCRDRTELVPLRLRRHEIPSIARSMLARHGLDLHFSPAAITALVHHDWPGNLADLADEISDVVTRRSAGAITDTDLLRPGRATPTDCTRNPLDTALHDAISNELRRHGGNKRATADHLGISRTTLYKRMRELHIPG
ncbi:sigma-54-dependent Fis family transcriptional regulator [Williamsia phyllosphaerae]|uniref:Siderophore-interacting protein n=1 Tax=Williamsia phyllosphaerae TaxID=885042 RepID=A0ABQ1UR63_9NOCA|nr:helix-turn-helix domain-containing protein [Williamsia phyllosphaerae]GGF24157.1 siderophore-interacting protein [Williamsia phyllosphaerae]